VPVENPAGVVYGVIVVGALLAAESGRHENYLDTEGSAVIAAGLYWLAHAYATVLGRRLTLHERLTARTLWAGLVHDGTLVRGASIPLAVILLAGLAGAPVETAVSAALWSVVASLVLFEVLAGARSRLSVGEIAFEAAVGVTLGVGILALRIVLH